jgi:hypothetical protein
MLKKLFILSLLSLANVTAVTALPATPVQETIDPAIDQKINEAVQRAEANVAEKLKNATRRDVVPMWSDKLALENAAIQLEVKQTIANNFKGTDSLKNAAVREKLLEILNKSDVTQADLAELQNLVNQFKANRNANTNVPDTKPLGNTGF